MWHTRTYFHSLIHVCDRFLERTNYVFDDVLQVAEFNSQAHAPNPGITTTQSDHRPPHSHRTGRTPVLRWPSASKLAAPRSNHRFHQKHINRQSLAPITAPLLRSRTEALCFLSRFLRFRSRSSIDTGSYTTLSH